MSGHTPSNALIPVAELLAEIIQAPPLRPLLARILDAACQLSHADTGAIGLYDPATDKMDTVVVRHALPVLFQSTFARGEGLAGHIIATGATYHGRYRDLPMPVVDALRDHESLGVPIRWQDGLLGYLALSVAAPRKFLGAQLELVELIARIAAIAIEHARREEEERRRSLRFELIARIAGDIHQELELDTLLQRAADAIHEVLRFPNVDIPLVDPAEPEVLVVRFRGGSYKRNITREDRLPFSCGIMGAAARERRTQMVNDVRADPRYVCPPGVLPAQAELAIPICSGNEVLGVLNVESNEAFDELDRKSLEVVAGYLAVAITNAHLFRQAREAAVLAERQRLARELHDNVTQILSSISLLSQSLADAWQRDPAEGQRRAARLQHLAQTAFAEMRVLLRELAPADQQPVKMVSKRSYALVGIEQLKQHALPGALTRLLAAMVPDALDLKLDFGGYQAQQIGQEEILFRVCQEAVSNAIRHAAARRLTITAAIQRDHAVLRVSDDGRGIVDEFRPGMGLSNMRTRLEQAGGLLRIAANSPSGTLIEARLPRADRATQTDID